MSIDKTQLKELIIEPVLGHLDLYSESAVQLLLGTAAAESNMGDYIKQVGGGPALGIYQMEPSTNQDVHDNYLSYRIGLKGKVNRLAFREDESLGMFQADEMIGNLYYATAMARIHYLRVPEALPEADDLDGLAHYWKKYYNTDFGKGTIIHFLKSWSKYVEED